MAKIVLNNITAGYASVDLLNQNFDAIEAAFENTLSRDGTSPNTLTADLDVNHQDLLNVGNISADGLTVGGQSIDSQLEEMQDLYDNTLALQNVTISTSDPSGGTEGDIWIKVSA